MVLLFSFFFCSGGFLVAHAESVTVVISGSNVTSKPSGWDGNSTYNRVVHYPTTKPEGLLNSYYDALSLSDIGYVTFDTLFQNTGNVQFPYTIQSRLSANFPSVTSWLPSNPHSYTVGSTGASLNYTSIARAGDMLELVPVSNVLLTPGVHYLLSVSLSSISSLESVGFVNYPSEVKVVDSIISISEVAGQTFFNGQISFTVSSPVSIRSLPVRSVFTMILQLRSTSILFLIQGILLLLMLSLPSKNRRGSLTRVLQMPGKVSRTKSKVNLILLRGQRLAALRRASLIRQRKAWVLSVM